MLHNPKNNAFSLVELSIVLVILGLLVGGVLGGRSLIRAAELRNITVEYQQWQTAVNTFREKYRALPGDMQNATQFWGTKTDCSPYGASTLEGTCNGNGNGKVVENTEYPSYNGTTASCGGSMTGNVYGERLLFWQHLSLAKLIPGQNTGAFSDSSIITGVNTPISKAAGDLTWSPYYAHHCDTWAWREAGQENTLFLGQVEELGMTSSFFQPGPSTSLLPEDVYSIDAKIDDGKPGYGKVRAPRSGNSGLNGVAYDCVTTISANTSQYKLIPTAGVTPACALYFTNAF